MKRFVVLTALVAMVAVGAAPALGGANARNFTAHLEGGNEVPAVDTLAQGQTIFHVAKDGESISYKLIASNIEDVTQAHIHIGAPDENGPVTVFLFGFVEEGVDSNGVLAQGTFTADDLIGPLAGQELSDLIDEIQSGNAYVNVHTVENPGGEIRGQID